MDIKNKIDYLKDIASYFGPKRIMILSGYSLVSIITELLSLILLIKFINSTVAQGAFNNFIYIDSEKKFVLVLFAIFILGMLSRIFAISVGFKYSYQVLVDITGRLIKKILEDSVLRVLDEQKIKYILANRLTDFAIKNLSHFSMIISQSLLIIGYVIIGIIIIGKEVPIIFLSFGLFYILVNQIFNRVLDDKNLFSKEKLINSKLELIVDYSKWVILNNKIDVIFNEIKRLTNNISKIYIRKYIIQILPKTFLDGFVILAIVIIIKFDYHIKYQVLSVTSLVIMISLSLKILPSLQSLFRSYDALITSRFLFQDIKKEILDIRNIELYNLIPTYNKSKNLLIIPSQKLNIFGRDVNVSNIEVSAGDIVKIEGKSGIGKSLLIDSLGFLNRYFNIAYSDEYFHLWKDNRVYFINQGSNLVNIINEKELLFEDINSANLNRLLTDFNFNKDDLVNRNLLSGGQRQLLNILIAISLDIKKVFIMDEIFSAIDSDTERKILIYLKNNYKEITFIIISHRKNNNDLYDSIMRLW